MIRSLGKRFIQDEGQALIARQLWEQRALFWRTVIFCGCAALLEGLGIGLLVPFLENITNPENQKAVRTGWTWLDTQVIALFLGEELSAQERLYRISGLLLTTILIRLLFGYIGRLNALKLQEASVYQIRRSIHDQLQSISLSFFSTARTGELMNTLTTEIQRLRFLFQTSAQVLIQILFLLIYVGVVLLLSWQMALLAFVFCILTFVALAGLIERLKQAGKAITKTNGEIASVFAEFVAGIRTIQASGSQDHESAKFDQSNRASRDAVVEAGKKNALVYPLSQSAASMMLIAVIVTSV
ncbi:MAG: ABC transporter ATP-binding protein, partial [Bacteroidota bacterium]